MNDAEFEKYRSEWRHFWIEKGLVEVRACKRTFEQMNDMTQRQRQLLIDDMTLMEHYKTKSHSTADEFEKIMEGFYRA